MAALTLALLAALTVSARVALGTEAFPAINTQCDAALLPAVPTIVSPTGLCAPVNDTCPTACRDELESLFDACLGGNHTSLDGSAVPFQPVLVAAGFAAALGGFGGPCREVPMDVLLTSRGHEPTCQEGLQVLYVGAALPPCAHSNASTCPAACELFVDVAFSHCEATAEVSVNGTRQTAAEAVARLSERLPSECSAVLGAKSFVGETRTTVEPASPPLPVIITECDAAFFPAVPSIVSPTGLCAPANGTCPTACRGELESLFDACLGGNLTSLGAAVPFHPVWVAVGFAAALSDFGSPCQEVPMDVLLVSTGYEPTCQEGLELLAFGAALRPCTDDNASTCPAACEVLADVAFGHCEATAEVSVNGTRQTAAEIVARSSTRLSSECSAVLGAKSFVGETQTTVKPSIGAGSPVVGPGSSMPSTGTPTMRTSSPVIGTTVPDREDASSSPSTVGAALSVSVLLVVAALASGGL